MSARSGAVSANTWPLPEPVGYVADRQAFLIECRVPLVVAADEPDAELPADRSPAELKPFFGGDR